MHQIGLLRGRELLPVLLNGLDKSENVDSDFILVKDATDKILKTQQVLLVHDNNCNHIRKRFQEFFKRQKIYSSIMVPIMDKGKVIGILAVFHPKFDKINDDEKNFFSAFGHQAGAALQNALRFQKVVEEKNHLKSLSRKIELENSYLKGKIKSDFVIGKSNKMKKVMDLLYKVAPTTTSVIIYGETGTGKELIGSAIHEMSPRKNEPLIKINCAAIPDNLLESELFGHEKGAFTGAVNKRTGMFQLANKGTIFLDEIGDLSSRMQTKLLRVLQEKEIQPLGSKEVIPVDVRIVAATNRNLEKAMNEKSFRADLFYRLNVFPIHLPSLKERKKDLPEFVTFFKNKYKQLHSHNGEVKVDQEVYEVFSSYDWPGNIRELENVIERLMIVSKGAVITKADLPKEFSKTPSSRFEFQPLREAILDLKKEMVARALGEAGGKKAGAAKLLGMPRSNFSRLLKNLDDI